MFSLVYNLPTTTCRVHRYFVEKSMCKQNGLFDHQNYVKKVRRNTVYISMKEITSKKVRGSKVNFFTIKITWKKVRRNNLDFLTIEITSKKVRGNNVDFTTIEITSKKVRGNDGDFLISEITSKNYVEMTWKFAEIRSSTYRRNTHVESTSIQHGVRIGCSLCHHDLWPFQKRCHAYFLAVYFFGLICRLETRMSSIFQSLSQKLIFNPVEYLRWSFLCQNS